MIVKENPLPLKSPFLRLLELAEQEAPAPDRSSYKTENPVEVVKPPIIGSSGPTKPYIPLPASPPFGVPGYGKMPKFSTLPVPLYTPVYDGNNYPSSLPYISPYPRPIFLDSSISRAYSPRGKGADGK